MKNHSLQHDTAIATMRAVMDQLKDELPYELRLTMMHLLYYSFLAGLERYEELVDRREHRLRPSKN